MQPLKLAFATLLFAALNALAVSAGNISFLYETLDADGTIDGDIFGTPEVRIRAEGDTANIQSYADGIFIDHDFAEIEILGVGTFELATGTRTFLNTTGDFVGFSRAGSSGLDLLNGSTDPQYVTWDMTTSIGPIPGSFNFLQWASSPVLATTGESLFFNNRSVNGKFTAIVDDTPAVPLPAAGWMLIAGLGGLGALKRFRKE